MRYCPAMAGVLAMRVSVAHAAMRQLCAYSIVCLFLTIPDVTAEENFASWPILPSTFPSTGGGGIIIKGYDPVVTNGKCVTTFMAVEPGGNPTVFPNYIEFEAIPAQGGVLCQNGRWRSFEGGASGTTPYRLFYKDGVFRGAP